MVAERLGAEERKNGESTVDRLIRLMGQIGVEPQLDVAPSERDYILGFEKNRPGKSSMFSILPLEDAARYSQEHIDRHPDDKHILNILKGSLAIGEMLRANPEDEKFARKLGRAMYEHKFGAE